MNDIIIVGYSGHAFVIADAIFANGGTIKGYCDEHEKKRNPYGLQFLGDETIDILAESNWIVGIGDNQLREKIYSKYEKKHPPISIIHPSAVIGKLCSIGNGVFVAANVAINALAEIGNGVIINTGAIIEHECKVRDFAHIAPGAVLAGNVTIGNKTFVGANCVIKQGVTIGDNVVVGAGTVVLNDVPDNVTIIGNPGKIRK